MTDFPIETYESAFRNIEAAFRSIGVPSFILDTDFVVRDVNTAGIEFTGYDYAELVGERITAVAGDESVFQDIADRVLDGEAWNGDFELETKDGDSVFGEGSIAPLIVDGENRGYVAVFVDTTKRRQYENTAEVLNRLLRHDLRNDMQVLYGLVQQAQLSAEDETVSNYLADAKEKATDIINKSDRARNLREHLERTYDATNHHVRLDYALHEAMFEPLQEFEEAEFLFGEFPSVQVVADDLLSTALEAIIENAVVHNDSETPVVEIAVEVSRNRVQITISDNGPGIPSGSEELIFGRAEEDPLHHGSGLSLFFVDNVVESYDGDLRLVDDDAEGATFVVDLRRP